jgi:undecaprenyl-diphosphatase
LNGRAVASRPITFDRLRSALRAAPRELRLLAILLALVAWAWALSLLIAAVGFARIQSFDERVLVWFRHADDLAVPIGPRWLLDAAREITALGSSTVLMLVTFSVLGYFWLERKTGMLVLVAVSTFGGVALSTALKELFGRPRPRVVPHLVPVASASFPSGHSLLSAVVYLTLGALLARAASDRATRIYFVALAAALSFLIGASRVYVGVHYPTDVLGGWLLGLAWALGCALVARALERRRLLPPAEPAADQRVTRSTRVA